MLPRVPVKQIHIFTIHVGVPVALFCCDVVAVEFPDQVESFQSGIVCRAVGVDIFNVRVDLIAQDDEPRS